VHKTQGIRSRAEYKVPESSAAIAFGVLGGLIEGTRHRKAQKKALAKAEEDAKIQGPHSLKDVLEGAARLIVFPKETITDIRYTWSFGLKIETSNKWEAFVLEGKKKTYEHFEPKIKEYLSH